MQRDNSSAQIRDQEGRLAAYALSLIESESILSQIQEPHLLS